MASYEQLSKYNWKATVSLGYKDGRQLKTRKQGFKYKKDAEKWVTDILNKKNNGFITPAENNILLKDYMLKWYYEHKINTISLNTQINYKSRIEIHILPKIGHLKLNQITNSVIQDFYNSLINDGQKASSAQKIMETLTNCLRYAKRNKLIYDLPIDIDKVKIEKPKVEFWNQAQVNFYLNEIKDTYLYKPVFIALTTGLRVGELCGLRWCDINFKGKYLSVNNQVLNDRNTKDLVFTNKLKTSTSYRKITLPNILIKYLKKIKGNSLETDFVVMSRNGTMCNPRNLSTNFSLSLVKYKDSIENMKKKYPNEDLDNYVQLHQITFHGLRHTHATLLMYNGENIKVVSERLGHRSVTITLDNYTHVLDDMKNDTAILLDKIFK